ncbi:MAG: ABC transporter permease [Saprospiraceae bacterium]|nr:ABC transporter permease [Saprospiraceae bacterium]
MFQHYLKVALRNMFKYKGYTLINLAGLTMGLAICFVLFLWINDERSYDRFHENADRIYRSSWEARFGDNEWKTPMVPVPLAETLEREFPEVQAATQLYPGNMSLQVGADYVREKGFLFVDEDFYDVFTIEVVEGEAKIQLPDLASIVVTTATAERYFGTSEGVVGKEIRRNDGNTFVVQGVVKPFPEQSHLNFDFLASLKHLKNLERRKTQWGSASCYTYFLVNEKADVLDLDKKLSAYIDENVVDDDFKVGNNYTSFPFEAITDIHLKPNLSYLWIFGIIAFFILILACVNFINLATARAITRAREIGLRKVMGSKRGQLVTQFFGEAFVFVIIAVVLAVLVADLFLPQFNLLADKSLSLDVLNTPFVWMLLASLVVFTTFVTGVFPATILSSFVPVKVLKGEISKSRSGSRFRKGLVLMQFSVSAALIIGTLIVRNQLQFLQDHDLGFDQEQVLTLRKARGLGNNFYPFLSQVRNLPGVQQASAAQYLPGDGYDSTIFTPEQPANFKETSLTYSHVDEHFVDLLNLDIIAGRNFDLEIKTDSMAYLINETAAKRLGWEDPVGRKLSYGGSQEGQIIGLVKDFNFSSLHEEVSPIILRMNNWKPSNIALRLEAGSMQEKLATIQGLWKEMAPNVPFEFDFMDDQIDAMYEREQRMSSIFSLFAGLAIFIACMGLLGLSSFMITQRTKEIGIRKVLGASVSSIVQLLSKDFLQLVVYSLLIAIPLAWYFMSNWLTDFAYRVTIHWSVFVLAGLAALGVAVLTISVQSVRAAVANPVDAIRSE